ncbi:MAG TPA: hypothetical protein VJ692_07905, partial [Nitrospiraceae bacterium]|nr:hypothetical protein [Nitrospiraceae bacterium]
MRRASKEKIRERVLCLSACVLMLALSAPAYAIPILPGGSGRPPASSSLAAGDVIASSALPFSGRNVLGEVLFTGTLATAVILESASQTLNFVYSVVNNSTSPDGIARMSVTNFAGVTTDIGWVSESPGDIGPGSVTRQPTGATISFNFDNFLRPGQETGLLFVKTNATDFHRGSVSLINGGVANISAFAPLASSVATVPEPAT